MTTMEVSPSVQSQTIWGYVLKLTYLRWVIFARGFQRASLGYRILTIGLCFLALGISVGIYTLSSHAIKQLSSPLIIESGINPGALFDAIPAVIVLAAFLISIINTSG